MKRIFAIIVLAITSALCMFGAVACATDSEFLNDTDGQILAVYKSYVDYTEEHDETPLSYEEWLKTIKGEDGATPTISIDADGFWVINGVKTEYKAQPENGKDGVDGKDGANGKNGLSAYELYKKYHPEYTKTEAEWVEDLANGRLNSACLVFTLNPEGTEYSVTGCTGAEKDVTIPSQYNNLPVTNIGQEAFYECRGLTNVVIPEGITSIESSAFSCCGNLRSINIPNSVTSIGSYAFSSCSSLTSVVIPDSVTSIGSGAFYNCSSLTSVKIGNGITNIAGILFTGCSSLLSIEIPNSVTNIESYAFKWTNFTSIIVGNSVNSIGKGAFFECEELPTIYYKGNATEFGNIMVDDYNNEQFKNATVYFYSVTKPTGGGNFWHYDIDGVTPVIWG